MYRWLSSTRLGEAEADLLRRRGGGDERRDELGDEGDGPLGLGVPLDADDPPTGLLPLERLDQSVGRQGRLAEDRGELADAHVVVAVDADLAGPVDLLEPSARLHDDGVAMDAALGVAVR